MNKKILGAAVAAAMVMPGMATAGSQADLEKSLRILESQISALKVQMAEMKEVQSAAGGNGFVGPENVAWGGAAEFEYAEGGALDAAKLELEAIIQTTDEVSGYVKLKATSVAGSSTLAIDEMAVTYDAGIAAISATTGGHPFGDFSSNMISDPFTKTIGDTGGTAKVLVDVPVGENVTLLGSADDDISSIAATVSIGDLALTIGHISDVEVDATKSANHIAASYSIGGLSLIAEKVDSDGSADATNVELAYAFTVAGHDAGVAIGRQERKVTNVEDWNMVSATVNIIEGLDLTVEHKDSNNNANDTWLGQLSYGF